MYSVRGIGVADSVSTSTSRRIFLRCSLCATPNRCSSSITTSPRSLKLTSFWSNRCVPMMTSIAARGQLRDDLPLLGVRPESRQHLDPHRERRQPLAECLEVLLRQHRRRHQHSRLLRVHHGLEGRADRHLRLPVADVAADQPVHRPRRLHVLLDRRDRRQLVGRLDVRERRLELHLPRRVRRVGVARSAPRARRTAASRSRASACTAFRTRCFARCHSPLASRVSRGSRSDGPM